MGSVPKAVDITLADRSDEHEDDDYQQYLDEPGIATDESSLYDEENRDRDESPAHTSMANSLCRTLLLAVNPWNVLGRHRHAYVSPFYVHPANMQFVAVSVWPNQLLDPQCQHTARYMDIFLSTRDETGNLSQPDGNQLNLVTLCHKGLPHLGDQSIFYYSFDVKDMVTFEDVDTCIRLSYYKFLQEFQAIVTPRTYLPGRGSNHTSVQMDRYAGAPLSDLTTIIEDEPTDRFEPESWVTAALFALSDNILLPDANICNSENRKCNLFHALTAPRTREVIMELRAKYPNTVWPHQNDQH